MKTFKQLIEEKQQINEGGEMYPADEMTMKELKIACYAAQNILDRLEDGAMIQRWQISAIVKAKEELASVYTSMSADEDDEEYDDEGDMNGNSYYDEYGYPYSFGEDTEISEGAKEKISGIVRRAKQKDSFLQNRRDVAMTKAGAAYASGDAKKGDRYMNWRDKSLAKEETEIGEADDTHKTKDGKTAKKGLWYNINQRKKKGLPPKKPGDEGYPDTLKIEEADFEVDVEGLPRMYVKANSPTEVKASLRKIVKKPDMIRSVERMTSASVKKIFRDKASGKSDTEE